MPLQPVPGPVPALLVATLLSALGGCGSDTGGEAGSGTADCSEAVRKQFVLDTTREWYLFPELLPSSVDLATFPDAESLLDHLTAEAREQRKDRFFSYLTTRAEDDAVLAEGQFNGFGFRTRTDPVDRPFIVDVFEASPAAEAGLSRGDEIIAVDSGDGFVAVGELLADGSTISDALGPPEVGVRRGLRLLRNGATLDVSLVKRTVTIDPVPDTWGETVLTLEGTTGAAYLHLRTHVSTADAQLRDAFARFRALGITDFIVDLRYDGGGLLATAELMNDLLGGAQTSGEVQLRVVHNADKSAQNTVRRFVPRPESVRPVRIAFLTTAATASASEINVNSMDPWVEVAIVGDDTLGKPVGQLAFDLRGCQDRLRLVAFELQNGNGRSGYYDGLADQLTFACAAEDTLDRPLGTADDSLVLAALDWLRTGACSRLIAPGPARLKPGGLPGPGRYPRPKRPSPVQTWLPGAV